MKKRLLTLILPAVLALSLSPVVYASDVENNTGETDNPLTVSDEKDSTGTDAEKDKMFVEENGHEAIDKISGELNNDSNRSEMKYLTTRGTINEVRLEDEPSQIKVTKDNGSDVIYNISENVFIFDLTTKQRAQYSDFKNEEHILMLHKEDNPQAETDSQHFAPEVILIGVSENSKAVADYFDEEGYSSNRDLKLNLHEGTDIVDLEGNAVNYKDAFGKNLLVIYTVETRSIPPQTSPEFVIVLEDISGNQANNNIEPNDNVGQIEEPNANNIIEGLEAQFIYEREGERFIALATVADKLGYSVFWNPENAQVTLDKDIKSITFKIGDEQYTDDMEIGDFITPPFIHNERTFVEASFIYALL